MLLKGSDLHCLNIWIIALPGIKDTLRHLIDNVEMLLRNAYLWKRLELISSRSSRLNHAMETSGHSCSQTMQLTSYGLTLESPKTTWHHQSSNSKDRSSTSLLTSGNSCNLTLRSFTLRERSKDFLIEWGLLSNSVLPTGTNKTG